MDRVLLPVAAWLLSIGLLVWAYNADSRRRARLYEATLNAEWLAQCSTPCDADCEQRCHEVHAVTAKRHHDPAACNRTAGTTYVRTQP